PAGAIVGTGTSMATAARAPGEAAPAAAEPKNLFGVSVATYLVEGRANTEKARLMGLTGLPARVVASKDGDFSVVLGAFTGRANAETAADDLINRGVVEEARVVTFPNPVFNSTSKQ